MPAYTPAFLPNEKPTFGILSLLAFQHVLAMFPATILVALLCGFHTSTVLLAAGLATIVALILSRNATGTFIPLFYGSSFSYIAAYLSVALAMGHEVEFGVPAPDNVISVIQAGILATGVLNLIVGFAMRGIGKDRIDKLLPPIVTGPVACVIGFALSYSALDMSFNNGPWLLAFLTLLVTVFLSHLLRGRGFLGMFPVLIGAIVGYLLTLVFASEYISFSAFSNAPLLQIPHITLPDFTGPMVITAVYSISIMAIATIPESTAHLYQMSIYVDELADEIDAPKVALEQYLGINLICDGVGDIICGACGGPAGTNYGENNSLMVITRNYSGPAIIGAGVICVLLAFIGKFSALIGTVPVFISGGLAVYLFGVIGMQGIALMQESNVNLFSPLQLAVGATIMVVGIGGHIGFTGGLLPITIPGIFPNGLPAIATAALLGICMHLVLVNLRQDIYRKGAAQVSIGPELIRRENKIKQN